MKRGNINFGKMLGDQNKTNTECLIYSACIWLLLDVCISVKNVTERL